MKQDLLTNPSHECYIVEVDGLAKSEYHIFVEALKASLQLKQVFPNSCIKLRDCYEKTPLRRH
jgi:mitochondrial fission protein ELM1